MHWHHRYARVNGLDMHYVEQGEGPLVILAHGFPHTWFSWHHQIPVIANAGYRVVAPDLRGMGQTSAPTDYRAYDVPHTVGDLTGLMDHLGEAKAIFIGLDFGLFSVYDMAYHHPERMAAIIGLENPAWPHDPAISPLNEAAKIGAEHFYHIDYFNQPDVPDAALNAAPRDFLTKVFFALSGDYHYVDIWKHPPGIPYLDALPTPPPLPWHWLSELEMEFFAADYARSGFTGGLNWYRSMDLRWSQRRRFETVANPVPFFFVGSENDVDLEAFHGHDPLAMLPRQYGDLREVAMVPRAGHMLQLERPRELNEHLLRFLAAVTPADWAMQTA